MADGRSDRVGAAAIRVAVAVLVTAIGLAASVTPALADLAQGTFLFDAPVNAVVHAPDGHTFVGGSFTQELTPTGSGVIVSASGTGAPDSSTFPRVLGGGVFSAASDGAGGWYIGGDFDHVGGVARQGLAHIRPDHTVDPSWDPNPQGYAIHMISAIAASGSTVYVLGFFQTIGGQSRSGLAALDATTGSATAWNPSPNGSAYARDRGGPGAIAVSGSTVYVAGYFTAIGGQSRAGLAALDKTTGAATSWNPGPVAAGYGVFALAVSGSTVYVGGEFTSVGGQPRAGLAALDSTTGSATSWNPASAFTQIYALALSGSTVYVAGLFSAIGGQPRQGLAAIDAASGAATAWNPSSPVASPRRLLVGGSILYVAGSSFESLGGASTRGLAAIDTGTGLVTSWNPNPGGRVQAIQSFGSDIYVGGEFLGAGLPLATVRGVARVDAAGALDTAWHPNPNKRVESLALLGPTLYLGGAFTAVGGQSRRLAGAVDATTGAVRSWDTQLAGGSSVYALAATGSTVYVGGDFSAAGAQARSGLAATDAASGAATAFDPHPVGGGVFDLAATSARLYASGLFTSIGGQPRAHVASFATGTGALTAFDPAPDYLVFALAATDTAVYVGGQYSTIGGQPRLGLAALDPNTGAASSFAHAPGGAVRALAVSGPTLYIGTDSRVEAVNAVSGTPTGFNLYPTGLVNSIAASDHVVYLGGALSQIGFDLIGPYTQLTDSTSPTDALPPIITITTPASGQHFAKDQSVNSVFSCDDVGGSGVKSCSGPPTVDTATAGAHQFTVTSMDIVGNEASNSVNYVVDATPPPPPPPSPPLPPPSPPPPLPPPPAPPPAPDTAAPAAKLTVAAQRLARTVVLSLSCADEACIATTTASVQVPRVGAKRQGTYRLKTVTAQIAKGEKRTIKLVLPLSVRNPIRRALNVRKRVVVSINATVADGAGNATMLSRRITLKR